MENKKRMWKILCTIAFLICVCCLGVFGWGRYKDYQVQKKQEAELKKIENTKFTGSRVGIEPKLPAGIKHGQSIDFTKLQKINDDIYSWIYVPGTKIDYPVAQSSTDDEHYLKYNYKNEPEFAGCIYTEARNKKDYTDPNTVLYGHNMRNGSMFQNLHKFEDDAFFKKHTKIYIYTPKKTFTYTIFAAYTYSDRHLLKTINFSNKKVFDSFFTQLYAQRNMYTHINQKMTISNKDKVITLSTCVGGAPSSRYLVQAVLTDERNAE